MRDRYANDARQPQPLQELHHDQTLELQLAPWAEGSAVAGQTTAERFARQIEADVLRGLEASRH